jgi:hypothetical protein
MRKMMSHSPDDEGRNRLWNIGQLQRVYMATAHLRKFQIILLLLLGLSLLLLYIV